MSLADDYAPKFSVLWWSNLVAWGLSDSGVHSTIICEKKIETLDLSKKSSVQSFFLLGCCRPDIEVGFTLIE